MSDQVLFQISGMTCAACSGSIHSAVAGLNGVSEVAVSLMTEEAKINFDSTIIKIDQIQKTIEDCGFGAKLISFKPQMNNQSQPQTHLNLKESKFEIQGMTCGACSASITEALESNPNIKSSTVSLLTGEGLIKHTGEINIEEIKEIIEDCGFDATHIKTINHNQNQQDQYHLQSESISEEDEISLQIFGINNQTDVIHLQYNIEAYLNSSAGIHNFRIAFKELPDRSNAPLVTDANSNNVQAMRSSDELASDGDNLIDELSVTYNPNIIGVRDLVEGLDNISPEISFAIINSIDQSSSTQLKMLSRIKEINYWRINFLQCLGFGIPIIAMSNTQKYEFWSNLILFPGLYWVSLLQFILAIHVQFKNGATFNTKFIYFIRNGGKNATMDVLVCISSSVSFLFSVISIILSVWSGQQVSPPKLLFDTSTMLIMFISFGKWLENKAKGATSTALSKLLALTPSSCTIISDIDKYERYLEMQRKYSKENSDEDSSMENFSTRTIGIDLIQTNDIAVVLPGGKIPADGVVVYGESEVNEAFITGETLPVHKKRGNQVIGGSINGANLIHIRVLKTGKKSQLHQIISLVKESQISKAPIQRFSDYIAARFVPTVLLLATITFLFWIVICYWTHSDSLPMAFTKDENGKFFVCLKIAISVIVVACPCALGLAAPTAVMVGTGIGAEHGVLIKGADILEKASGINVILFDKTGTLTTGDMKLVNHKIISNSNFRERDWWTIVGSVESNSEHPVGRAITKAAKSQLNLNFEEDTFDSIMSDFKVLTGLGISATIQIGINKYSATIGNYKLMENQYPNLMKMIDKDNEIDRLNTIAYVIINDEYCGNLQLSDNLKKNSREIIQYLLQHEHYQVGMVTGDSKEVAEKLGKELGIASYNIFSQVTPIDKDKVIVDIKKRLGGVGVAFIGDGINDAPALAQADIGMAISTGTDIAIESADIVLVGSRTDYDRSYDESSNDLIGVLNALHISNATFSKVKVNFIWAAIYNMIMLPFAMGCFLPFNVMLPPIAAACAMMLSSVSVVLSSLTLKSWKAPRINEDYTTFKVDLEAMNEAFNLKEGTREEFELVRRKGNTRTLGNPISYMKNFFNRYYTSRRVYTHIPSSL
ncbi:copper-transporting ATPase [Scheffersomyces amazonensis]|uniref:copper-transporting ATPase n=1 Tax=Scheffersomyces amazonensis TaxID=1078765 RepID=UPI00315D8ECD